MGGVELTPPFVSNLLESVAHSGIDRGSEELPVVADVRRLPLFRQSRVEISPETLVEDCRRLHRSRGEWMVTGEGPVDPERLIRLENSFQARSATYQPGHFLSLVRLGLDIQDTERNGLTVLERRTLHLLERRLFEMQRSERPASPERVAGWLSDLHSGEGWRLRGLADLVRYVDEVTGHPLVGHPDQATSDVVHLLLALHWALGRLSPVREGPLGITPLDLCLGARSVLTNAKVLQLRLGALQDLVLSPELALWVRLGEWLSQVSHEREATFQLPPREALPDFQVEGKRLRAFDLVLTVGERLERSVRRLSIDESLVALERTLHRRIHRQEARKRHMAVLLRRVFERALNECHRRSMRVVRRIPGSSGAVPVEDAAIARAEGDAPDAAADPSWTRLKEAAEDLEECRAWGCSTSAEAAWRRFFPGVAARSEELADLDELLRWALDCRDDLDSALDRWPEDVHSALRSWFLVLSERAASVEIPRRQTGARRRRERATPLQWFAASRAVLPGTFPDSSVLLRDPAPALQALSDPRISRALVAWIHRHPWDRSLCGIWPPELRGPALADGVRVGVLRSRFDKVPWWELDVRLGMLSRELEYRCWLGARERPALLARTLSGGGVPVPQPPDREAGPP